METFANVVVVVHLVYFGFIVGGCFGILIGALRQWRWIYNPWFRTVHFLSVMLVLAEDVFHFSCPLNTLEEALRSASGNATPTSGMGYVLDLLLRHTIPGRMLDGMYWTVGVMLVLLLFIVRPHFRKTADAS